MTHRRLGTLACTAAIALCATTASACGPSSSAASAACARARDAYLAGAPGRIAGALSAADPATVPELRARADAELVAVRTRFVPACQQTDGFDPTCFTEPQRGETARCDALISDLLERVISGK